MREPTRASVRTSKLATVSVAARRDMAETLCGARALAGPDPLVAAISEGLVLPNGHLRLEVVDEPAAGVKRLAAMGAGRRDDDGQVTDLQVTDAVEGREGLDGIVRGDLLHDGAEFAFDAGVGAVGQPTDGTRMIVIADGTDEHGGAAGGWVAGGGTYLIHRQRRLADTDQPDDVTGPGGTDFVHLPQATRPGLVRPV